MREDFKIRLRWALKECGGGNAQARNLVREYIRKILLDDYKIRSDTLDKLILFQEMCIRDRSETDRKEGGPGISGCGAC